MKKQPPGHTALKDTLAEEGTEPPVKEKQPDDVGHGSASPKEATECPEKEKQPDDMGQGRASPEEVTECTEKEKQPGDAALTSPEEAIESPVKEKQPNDVTTDETTEPPSSPSISCEGWSRLSREDVIDKVKGVIYGQAIGDAIGICCEKYNFCLVYLIVHGENNIIV